MLSGGLVIITPAQEEEPEIKSQVLDFQGLEVLKGVFQQYYPKLYKQTSCNDVNRDTLNNHLLLVAGPVANTVTKHILKPENNSVRYYFKDHSIVDKYHPEVSLTEELIQQGMYPEFDYGIISFLKNPFNSKKHVIISSGVYGWGTYGGLLVISDKEKLKFLNETTKGRDFQVLVKVGIYKRLPEEPILLTDTLHIIE
jgi:hypothetical protein